MVAVHSYSFADVQCSLIGPGFFIQLGNGAGSADEGITVEPSEDVGTQTAGADGSVMMSLHAARPGIATIRLLKTSPTNQLLSMLYSLQTSSASLYGQNTIAVSDVARGDLLTCLSCAIRKFATINYRKTGDMNEWAFFVGYYDPALGSGAGT
jgi:hypothetical protein